MYFLSRKLLDRFEEHKEESGFAQSTIMMISGCDDHQSSSDVGNVDSFQLPDPAGKAGGACTSALLQVLYKQEKDNEKQSFAQVLEKTREVLEEDGYTQIPQLTSLAPLDVHKPFDMVPDECDGTRRALLIGINYVGEDGELSGCHNDALNMKEYIKDVHGFEEENITMLMDDGEHEEPTKENMMNEYKKLVEESEEGDAIFIHFSGHGTRVRDKDGDEDDGYDEALCPVDCDDAGLITDDELFATLVKPLPKGVTLTSLMDCCNSGTVLDLPYKFKSDGEYDKMEIDSNFNFNHLFALFGASAFGQAYTQWVLAQQNEDEDEEEEDEEEEDEEEEEDDDEEDEDDEEEEDDDDEEEEGDEEGDY